MEAPSNSPEYDEFEGIASNNATSGHNYCAGILPYCMGPINYKDISQKETKSNGSKEEDDEEKVPYFLLGRQGHATMVRSIVGAIKKEWGEKLDETTGYCVFWGWQDKGDLSVPDTAAREATEEANGVLGSREFLREWVGDMNCRLLVFDYCFLISLGKLSSKEMQDVVKRHSKKRLVEVNPTRREMIELKWIPALDLYNAFDERRRKGRGQESKVFLPQFGEGNHLREWFERDLEYCIFQDPLYTLCTTGKDPLEGARDRWREWLNWAWVPTEDKKEKDKDKVNNGKTKEKN